MLGPTLEFVFDDIDINVESSRLTTLEDNFLAIILQFRLQYVSQW